MHHPRIHAPTARLAATLLLATFVLAACVPISTAFLRNVDGQTWAARFDVAVGPVEAPTLRLPVDLALTFRQSWTDVSADASLEYDAGLFRLGTRGLVALTGRLGIDDRLDPIDAGSALRSAAQVGLRTFALPVVDDEALDAILITGTLTADEDEPLDIGEIDEEERKFWSNSWDEPEEW